MKWGIEKLELFVQQTTLQARYLTAFIMSSDLVSLTNEDFNKMLGEMGGCKEQGNTLFVMSCRNLFTQRLFSETQSKHLRKQDIQIFWVGRWLLLA